MINWIKNFMSGHKQDVGFIRISKEEISKKTIKELFEIMETNICERSTGNGIIIELLKRAHKIKEF